MYGKKITFASTALLLALPFFAGCTSVDNRTTQSIAKKPMSAATATRLGIDMTPLAYSKLNLKQVDERFKKLEKNNTSQTTSLSQFAASAPNRSTTFTAALGPRRTDSKADTLTQTLEKNSYHLPLATPRVKELIKLYAKAYNVPERLVRRVVFRESRGNPEARNGPYWGLMQISYPTAVSMGYSGKPTGLLEAEINLRYAVKYLAGAYLVSGGDEARAVRLYARGFYYDAKAKGVLEETGLRPGPRSLETAFATD